MSTLRFAVALSLLFAAGCPAPEPAKGPPPPAPVTEAEARDAFERAKAKGDPDQLIAVFNKYGKFSVAKTALRLGVRKLLEDALTAAEACKAEKASQDLAKVAPYTTDDPEIDEAYDETKVAVAREHSRCSLIVLDAEVKAAETAWDFPKAFARIGKEKDADGAALSKRRVELTARWRKWLDETLKQIVAKRSVAAVVGDKRDGFDSSTDGDDLPAELAPDLAKRGEALLAIRLVFEKLEGGVLLDPPVPYWTYGAAKARRIDAPATEGAVLANGVAFTAVAKGKLNGTMMLVAGNATGDAFARLASIKLLLPEADARTWDTRIALPEQLVGARVLAPVTLGSDVLHPVTVLSEDGKGSVAVAPLSKKTQKLTFKKTDLRGLAMSPGMKVIVMVNGIGKPGELATSPEEERVLVRVAGFESYFPLGDIRVKRGDLPKPPPE